MAKNIKISRHGLTSCPACSAHIRVADELHETACPFCGADLMADAGGGVLSSLRSAVSSGRSGLVAASLFGLTALAGCGDDEDPAADMSDTASDTQDMADDTADDTMTDTPSDAPDLEVQPLYGLPADMTPDTNPDATDADDAEDAPPAPLYGIAPDMG